VQVAGERSHNIVSFLRAHQGKQLLASFPRWLSQFSTFTATNQLQPDWNQTEIVLPQDTARHWHNLLTGETLSAGSREKPNAIQAEALFRNFPVALLESAEP